MSGMVGIWDFERGQMEPRQLRAMLDRLAHRGPDGSDIWWRGGIGLGHCALWTTPESVHEVMPLKDPSGQFVITADARIDNREELYSQLGLTGSEREKGDGYIILQAYLKWGSRCPKYLLGDFAFAIWDGPQQLLFCARDHMGIKPFYYSYEPRNGFAFASEMKGLFSIGWISTELNKEKVVDFLLIDYEDVQRTFYKGIQRLPKGSFAIIKLDNLKIRTYWNLEPNRELKLGSEKDYGQVFKEIFIKAVNDRLRANDSLGFHLSGGLDSSSIVCTAYKLLENQVRNRAQTFSNVFEHCKECDESKYINLVLDQNKELESNHVKAEELGPLSEIELIFASHDELRFGPTHFLLWGLNKASCKKSMRIILDGFDGDTVLSHGESHLCELASQGKWEKFNEEIKYLTSSPSKKLEYLKLYGSQAIEKSRVWGGFNLIDKHLLDISRCLDLPYWKLWLEYVVKLLIPQSISSTLKKRKEYEWLHLINEIFGKDFINQKNVIERIKAVRLRKNTQNESGRYIHFYSLSSGLVTEAMEAIDLSYSVFSLEARHPYMDKRVVEFCLSIPTELKLNKGWTRKVLRLAMKDILPEEVRQRRDKANMQPVFLHGLTRNSQGLLRNWHEEDNQGTKATSGEKEILSLIRKCLSTKDYNEEKLVFLWQLSALALWMKFRRLEQKIDIKY